MHKPPSPLKASLKKLQELESRNYRLKTRGDSRCLEALLLVGIEQALPPGEKALLHLRGLFLESMNLDCHLTDVLWVAAGLEKLSQPALAHGNPLQKGRQCLLPRLKELPKNGFLVRTKLQELNHRLQRRVDVILWRRGGSWRFLLNCVGDRVGEHRCGDTGVRFSRRSLGAEGR